MNMRMVLQVLAPGMEHADETDLGAEMARVGGDRAQRFGCRPEQDRVHRRLVLEGDLGGRRRQREDDVEIRHRQQFGLSLGQPCRTRWALAFRAMTVATRILGNADQAAVGTTLGTATELSCPARLDRAHDAALCSAKMTGTRLTIRLAVAAEDVRHLQSGYGRFGSGRRDAFQLEPVERADRVADRRGSDLGIAGCGRQVAMTEQHLDRADIGAGFEQMGGGAYGRSPAYRASLPCERFGTPTAAYSHQAADSRPDLGTANAPAALRANTRAKQRAVAATA
jgi:hypothetical protein